MIKARKSKEESRRIEIFICNNCGYGNSDYQFIIPPDCEFPTCPRCVSADIKKLNRIDRFFAIILSIYSS